MIKRLYSVKDTVRGYFNPPFVDDNDNSAIRTFKASAGSSPFKEDFALYKVGVWQEETGEITEVKPEFLCYFNGGSSEVGSNG